MFTLTYIRVGRDIEPGLQPYPLPPNLVAVNTPTVLPYLPPGENPLPTPTFELTGPTCYIDSLNHFSIQLPSGWRANTPPDINAVGGASVFYNYNPEEVISNHGAVKLPPNAIKIQITSAKLSVGQSFEQWVNESATVAETSDISRQYTTTATAPYQYNIANYEGMAYTVSDLSGTNIFVIDLFVESDKILIIAISPADSPGLSEALLILPTLNTQNISPCLSGINTPDRQIITISEVKNTPSLYQDYTCNLGSFAGTEARNSGIPLQMPFLIGETWIVGGGGSFYGNNHHCNYYNNYYATDWNKQDGNDENASVLAIADGIVTRIDIQCTTTRYGCYVQIDHQSNYRTLYAHLNTIYVLPNTSITVGQTIGRVGCTGNCVDPHLHMSFWHRDRSDYPYHYANFSQCYNRGAICPNGETPYYPQGYRPSPMWTTYGNTILADGIAFTSVNGHQVFLPIVIK